MRRKKQFRFKLSRLVNLLLCLSVTMIFSIIHIETPRMMVQQEDPSRKHGLVVVDPIVQQQQPNPPGRRMFLHIGPHKSATTTIQCALHQYAPMLRDKDSMVYLGKFDPAFCGGSSSGEKQDERIRKIDQCVRDNEECWGPLIEEWKQHGKEGMDMILSKESLSDWTSNDHSDASYRSFFWSRMATALHGWNVTVLVTYRRYYEWLPSAYTQHLYHTQIQKNAPWPDAVLPTFAQFLEDVLENRRPPPYPYLDTMLQFKFPTNWNVRVLNLHNTNHAIVETLLCEVFQARNTCNSYQQIAPKRTSQSDALFYDRLNVQATLWGWLSGGRRFARMKATRRFVEQHLSNMPKECPDKALLARFLERSLALEQQILVGHGGDHRIDQRHDFWNSTDRFCTPNASSVLLQESKRWKEFYDSL